jgi:predicted DNA-binding transcriptional regulator AlpA
MDQDIYRLPEVCRRTGLSKATIYRMERARQFPARRRLSPKTVGYLKSEVDKWIETRILIITGDVPRIWSAK